MKITGLLETYLTDKNRVKRKIGEGKNNIDLKFYKALASYLSLHNTSPNNLIVFSNLFTGGNGYANDQPEKDGITAIVYGSGLKTTAFATTITQPGTNKFRATGVWTNPEPTSITLITAQLGVNWLRNDQYEPDYHPDDGGWFSGFLLAYGGMSSTVVPSGDTLTIVWTITFTVH